MRLTIVDNRYIGDFISRLATLGNRWDMHASRKILLRHFDVRAAEYRTEMDAGSLVEDHQTTPGQMVKPVITSSLLLILLPNKS